MTKNKVTIHNRPNRSYQLDQYDHEWVNRYNQIATKIKPLFGDNLIQIEHVGSTSVPGMIAKPTVDVSVEVKDITRVRSTYEAMEALGFVPLGDFIQQAEPEEYFILNGTDNHDRLVNVHVMQTGNPDMEQMITLRDFLRASAEARLSYIEHKRKLMSLYGEGDYNSYSKNKRDFLEDLKAQARHWKSQQSS